MSNDFFCRCGKPGFVFVDDTTVKGYLCYECYLEHEQKRRENIKKFDGQVDEQGS